jgi:hypothetical protein
MTAFSELNFSLDLKIKSLVEGVGLEFFSASRATNKLPDKSLFARLVEFWQTVNE